MKEEFYVVYRTAKGDENSADEAILLGDLKPEILDALKVDIKERNVADDVGELVLDKRQNRSQSEKKRLEILVLGYIWNRGRGKGNPTLSALRNHYLRECDNNHEKADFWLIMIGQSIPPEHYVLRTIEEIRWAKSVIASVPRCSDTSSNDNDAMVEYALRLIWLYEFWLPPTGFRWSITFREMFLYIRRCLAWTGNDYSEEKIIGLLKRLNQKPWELIEPEQEHVTGQVEHGYELTDLGRIRAVGSMKSLSIAPDSDIIETEEAYQRPIEEAGKPVVDEQSKKRRRRSKAERRGILEEAIDFQEEHPCMTDKEIVEMFGLERGALSKESAMKLKEGRKRKNPQRSRIVDKNIGDDLVYGSTGMSKR